MRALLRIPGIPYNVRELFLDHASLTALSFFALTLLWIGAGAVLTVQTAARSKRPYLTTPLILIGACLLSKMLLSRSVTYESIDDIIGSNTLFGMVTTHNAWGPWWARTFAAIGVDAVDFLERRVRYAALYSIPVVAIVVMLIVVDRPTWKRLSQRPVAAIVLTIVGALWLWLARTIVVPWAGTDNLTELLANHPPFGVPGEWYLFGIATLVGLSTALLLRLTSSPMAFAGAAAVSVAAIPVGWLLLNMGLEPRVEKYGTVFSGAQFLLGPDRTHALPQSVLFLRWAALQAGSVAVTFAGAWIARSWFRAFVS